jgi:hypothetical protein
MTVSLQAPQFPSTVNRGLLVYLPQSRTPRLPPMVQISTFIPCSAPRRQESVYTLPPARPPCVRALPMPQLRPMTCPLSTANLPTPFPIHIYPLLPASFVRAEAPRDGEVLPITTLFIPSLLFRPPRLPLPRFPPFRHPCVPHPLRPLVQTIALRGPHSKPSIPPTATTIFHTSTDMGP